MVNKQNMYFVSKHFLNYVVNPVFEANPMFTPRHTNVGLVRPGEEEEEEEEAARAEAEEDGGWWPHRRRLLGRRYCCKKSCGNPYFSSMVIPDPKSQAPKSKSLSNSFSYYVSESTYYVVLL